jgi:hypothetical protein
LDSDQDHDRVDLGLFASREAAKATIADHPDRYCQSKIANDPGGGRRRLAVL